ncbi:hypothetical protein Aoki45_32520 [Algoriphagus sp. oki45]|nr:hypothetical protein Aoki45_32520 [Algoriphagus sp. oki45]
MASVGFRSDSRSTSAKNKLGKLSLTKAENPALNMTAVRASLLFYLDF